MADNFRVVIIHGAYGSPEENWLPWLAEELQKQGREVLIPSFPTPKGQSLSTWRTSFSRQVGDLDKNMILVGHSLGVGFILNLLEQSTSPVLGCFLVSAFVGLLGLPEFDLINASFISKEFDWKRIKANAGFVRVYNGDNDPYVPLERGREIAERLGVILTVIQGGGHINASAGYTRFPKLLSDLTDLMSKHKAS